MDFGYLMEIANKNKNTSQKTAQIKRYSTEVSKAKKERKSSVNPDAIKAFLNKQDEDEKKKLEVAKRQKEKLLALRAANPKSNKAAKMMKSRTKDNDFSIIKLTEDEAELKKKVNDEMKRKETIGKLQRMKLRIEIEQKNRDSMLTQKKRRKRRHVDADGKEYMDYSELKIYDSKEMRKKHRQDILYEKIKREIEVLEKTKTRPKVAEKKQARRPPPPSSSTMDFDKLMRLANKLQHRPVEVKQVETESTEERPKSKKEKIDRQTEKAHRSSGDKKQSVVKDVKKSTANPDRDKIREVPNHGAPKSNVGVAKVKSDTVLPVSGKSSAGEHKSCRRYKIHSSIHDRTINDKKSVTPYQTSKTISDKKPPPVYRMSKTLSDKKPVPAYQMSKTPSDKKPVPAYQMSKTLSDKKPVPAYQTSRKSLDVPQYTTSLSKSEKRLPSYSTGDKTDSKIPSYSTDKRDGSNVPKYSTKMNGKNKEVSRYSTPSSKRDIPSYSTSKPPSDPVEKRRPRPDQAAPSKRKDSSDRNGQKLSLRGQHPPSGRDLPKHPSSMARKERPPSPGSRFRMPQKTLNRSNRIESDSDEEYDDEMADFIDDGRQDDDMDYSSHIREIFGYDKSRYLYEDYEDEEVMEASFAEQMKEEGRSARIGLMEDLEDIRREEEELKKKLKKKKK